MKKFLSLILAGMMALSVASCGAPAGEGDQKAASGSASTESDWQYISDKGEMIIGITLFAPMNYKEGNELVGFETEFAKAVCEKLGVTPKFQEIDWGSKEIELNAKNIDCIWNGMTITDELKQNMSISVPYMNNKQVMITKKENVEKYAQSTDGANVVAESGSAGDELATTDEFFKGANYTAVDSQAKALMDVESGSSDVAIVDYVLSIGSIGEGTDYSDLAVIESKEFGNEEYGVAFRKDSDVTEKVNAAMQELAADGTLNTIAEKYKLEKMLLLK